jgi:integrase
MNKKEIIEFIEDIGKESKHKYKSLFFELQYTYGRRSREISYLKVSDIDFINNQITFKICKKKKDTILTLNLFDNIKEKIDDHIQKNNLKDDDYLFIKSEKQIDSFLRNLRQYLERNSQGRIKQLFNKDYTLNTHDFRRLRGQHLYLAGFNIEIIQQLYYHEDQNITAIYLQINELQVNKMLNEDLSN